MKYSTFFYVFAITGFICTVAGVVTNSPMLIAAGVVNFLYADNVVTHTYLKYLKGKLDNERG